MKYLFTLFIACLPFVQAQAQLFPNLGGQRIGISALTFLKNDLSPRSLAMGSVNVSLSGAGGYANITNPALAAELPAFTATASSLLYSELTHNYAAAYLPLESSGIFGLAINNLSSGEMELRTEFAPQGTGQMFSANNTAIGLSYARSLSDRFDLGIQAKYIREQLAEYNDHTATIDLGFLYKTDYKKLQFAVMLQNFGNNTRLDGSSQPVTFNDNGTPSLDSYPPPTTFKLGLSMHAYETEEYKILAGLQLNSPTDNAENLGLGLEGVYRNLFFVRAGYQINVDGQKLPSFGAGVHTYLAGNEISLDYGTRPTEFLGLYHAVGLSFTLRSTARTGEASDDDTENIATPSE